MGRLLLTVAASAFATALLIGGVGLLAFRSGVLPRVAEATGLGAGPWDRGMGAGPWAADLPAEIRDLHNLPPEERFGHFLGGQLRFNDVDDKAHTVSFSPGTVDSIKSDELTLKLNDGGSKTYKLNNETRIHAPGQRWNASQAAAPRSGDKVVVVTLDGSDTARGVLIGGPDGFRPHGGPFHRG